MKLLVIGDLQLISPHTAPALMIERRKKFALAWPSFRRLLALAKKERPDLIILLGDLIDWYSDENRDFALELLAEPGIPWVMTPGNHDFEGRRETEDGKDVSSISAREGFAAASKGWSERGVGFRNRIIDDGKNRIILLNSAFSEIEPGTEAWLERHLEEGKNNILFTHVPPDTPETREYILSRDPHKNMQKYVQSFAPHLFQRCLKNRVQSIFCGHLHYPGSLCVHQTNITLLGMGIDLYNEYTARQECASGLLLNLDAPLSCRYLSTEAP